jgi:serine/threonine protein kinase
MDAHPVSHPTDQTLSSYGLGQLDDASAESVNAHLEGCPACRRRVAEISSDSSHGRLGDPNAGPESLRPALSSAGGLSMLGAAPGTAPPVASALAPGLAGLADYEILRELGRGGMGVVYLAQNTLMGRPEVLKVVGGQVINRPGVADRFLREIRSAARLHHPNIVTAYSAIRFGESLVLAMEYVEGLDLAKLVKAKGPLPVANACYYVHQAALGLQHAHEHGMVHRDIKPGNLMLMRQGRMPVVKVLDFGLAKVSSEGQADSGLTREGQMLGTPDYIAPEQIRNAQTADIRADIYSLGCTFYYLLTGGPPFSGDNLWDLYQAHFSMDAGPLHLARPEVPVELAALVAKMMAKEPAQRFQTPGEVARALSPFFKPGASPPAASSGEASRTDPQVTPHQKTTGVGPAADKPGSTGPPRVPSGRSPSTTGGDGVGWRTLIEIKKDEPSTPAAKPQPAEPKPVPAEMPARLPLWFWPSVAAGVLVMATLAGALVLGLRRGGEADSSRARASASYDETVQEPVEARTPSRNRPDSTSILAKTFERPDSASNGRSPVRDADRRPETPRVPPSLQPLGANRILSATNKMTPEPETLASRIGTARNESTATKVVKAPGPPAITPEPRAPGVVIQEDYRNLADDALPAGWRSQFKNVVVQRGPGIALTLKDPSLPDRLELPRADLKGDFTIDLEFALPSSSLTSVQLHLQGTPTENLYVSVFGDGMVQTQVARRPYRLPGRGFQADGTNKFRLERRRGKYSVELNGVVVGDIRINIGEVHYKSLSLTLGPVPESPTKAVNPPRSPPARGNLVGRSRAPLSPSRGRGISSPRIHSLRVAVPAPGS